MRVISAKMPQSAILTLNNREKNLRKTEKFPVAGYWVWANVYPYFPRICPINPILRRYYAVISPLMSEEVTA